MSDPESQAQPQGDEEADRELRACSSGPLPSAATVAQLQPLFQDGSLPVPETILLIETWRARSPGELRDLDESGALVAVLQDLSLSLQFSALYHARYPTRPHDERFHLAGLPTELPIDPAALEEARGMVQIEVPECAISVSRNF